KHEREILFARSHIFSHDDEKTHKEQYSWNAKVESENEYTQMILLTWVTYDQYIQQTMQISAAWNYRIDLNLIYVALRYCFQGDINQTIQSLTVFKQWKYQNNNKQKYKEGMHKFLERRCCNHNVNLFCMFFFEVLKETNVIHATINTVSNGLPFVGKNKKI
ncbi:hypothetical protein RFI_36435, partial [Reticulomyxa filosa]